MLTFFFFFLSDFCIMVSDTLRVLHITFSFAETVVVECWNLMQRRRCVFSLEMDTFVPIDGG